MVDQKDLKELQEKFKKGYKGMYIPELIKAMNRRRKQFKKKKKFDAISIYNIFNGLVKNEMILAALYEEGSALLLQYESKIQASIETAEENISEAEQQHI